MTFIDPFFWLNFLYFFFAVFLAFFVPGDVFIKKLRRPLFQRVIFSIVFGMVLWTIQGYILGYAHVRWASYIYLMCFFILWVTKNVRKKKIQFFSFQQYKQIDLFLIPIITIGVIIQFFSVGFNGIFYNNTLHFCCNIPDSIYHIALVHALIQNVPPQEPGAYDVVVRNYHYFSNLCTAELIRVFRLPFLYTQDQYMTVFLSFLIGFSAIVFAQVVKLGKAYIRWLVFFLYFYGDFIFLLSFLLGNGINFTYTMQENAATLWTSPPRVFGLVVFFIGLAFLKLWIEKKSVYLGILMAIMLGSLIGFKVYIGIFAISGLVVLGLYYLIKRDVKMLLPLCIAGIMSLCFYVPTNSGSGGISFSGFWRLEDFVVNPAYNLSHLELARRVYLDHKNWLRVAQYESIYILLYIPSLFGIYLLGFFQTKKSLSAFSIPFHIYLLCSTTVTLCLGVFFLQDIGGANTSQFLFPLYIVGAIYTALTCSFFLPYISKPFKGFFIVTIILLTIPRVFYTTYKNFLYITQIPSVHLDEKDMEAFSYLQQTPTSSIVLIGDKNLTISNESYYFSFLTNRKIFLAGSGILTDHGVHTKKKLQTIETILYSKNASKVASELLKNNITYLYMPSTSLVSTNSAYFLKPVFNSDTIRILKVQPENVKAYIKKYAGSKKDY